MTLDELILAAFRASGKSPTEVARAAQVPVPTVTRWLRGQRGLSVPTAQKIAHSLGVDWKKAMPEANKEK